MMYYLTKHKEMLGFSSFKNFSNIFNFTTSRNGGESLGAYGSLNCYPYSGDDLESVNANMSRLLKLFPLEPTCVVTPYQTHEDKVLVIDNQFSVLSVSEQKELLHGVDAVVTNNPKFLLTVATADCVPITFYDSSKNVVALAHAGWRGTVAKIVVNVLTVMKEQFESNAKDIFVGIGPSISLKAFEVGDEVVAKFKENGFDLNEVTQLNTDSNKYHIDLWKANRLLLEECGVPSNQIEEASICTFTKHNQFFSARRLGIKSGRITTGIMILE